MFADIARLPTRRASASVRRRERVGEVLEQCGLTAVRSDPVGSLPIGLARMVEFARAIVDEPKLLLLDEPTSGLDDREAERLIEQLAAPADVVDVRRDAGRARHGLRDGAVRHGRRARARPGDRDSGTPKAIQENPLVRAAYLGEGSGNGITGTPNSKGDSRETQEGLDLGRDDCRHGTRRGNGGYRRRRSAESGDERGDETRPSTSQGWSASRPSAAAMQGGPGPLRLARTPRAGCSAARSRSSTPPTTSSTPRPTCRRARRVVSCGQRLRDRPDGDGRARRVRLPRPAEGAVLRLGHLGRLLRQRLRLRLHRLRGAEDAGVRQHVHARGRRQGARSKDPKGLTVAIIAEDTDAARSGLGTLGTAAESLGMKVVYSKGVVPAPPATVGDFTPFSQAIMTSNNGAPPDIVIMLFASIPSTLGLQGALQAAGFKGPIENTQTYDPQLAAPVEGWQRLRAVRCVRDRRHGARREADGRPICRRPMRRSACCRPSATSRPTCSSRR